MSVYTDNSFDEYGNMILNSTDGAINGAMLNIDVHKIKGGEERKFLFDREEAAFLLLTGDVSFEWNGQSESAKRGDLFTDGPSCLHASSKTEVTVKAAADSELLIERTENAKRFFTVMHNPVSVMETRFGIIGTDGKPSGIFRTIFDSHTAPHSNLVIGEVIAPQGGWADYPPHHHPQPEVHYYRFDKPQGFGLGLVGDEAFKIRNNGVSVILDDRIHPQVAAPWYTMYFTWMIRNFNGAPWNECIIEEEHKWMMG